MSDAQCPYHKLRSDLPPLTDRIARLPVDARGYPVPFFVAWIDGLPEFRVADPSKLVRCINEKLCWVCGEPLGVHLSFVIGPMCAISRTTAEPPSHRDCAEWSLRGCPFLTKPQMVRREDELTGECSKNVAGDMIPRNPGVSALWMTKSFSIFRDQNHRPLFSVGDPTEVTWWREGRTATRQDVLASISSGLPLLKDKCEDPDDLAALEQAVYAAGQWLPKQNKAA